MLAALASHSGSLGGLSSLAGSLLGGHTTTALFINLLHSGTVSGHLIDRFHLQHVYRKRYRIDTAKHLAHLTSITEDKKSGVITIEVEDEDPVRARDLAQGYLDELNKLVMQTNTSAAHRERVFIERRLHSVAGGPRTRAASAEPILEQEQHHRYQGANPRDGRCGRARAGRTSGRTVRACSRCAKFMATGTCACARQKRALRVCNASLKK